MGSRRPWALSRAPRERRLQMLCWAAWRRKESSFLPRRILRYLTSLHRAPALHMVPVRPWFWPVCTHKHLCETGSEISVRWVPSGLFPSSFGFSSAWALFNLVSCRAWRPCLKESWVPFIVWSHWIHLPIKGLRKSSLPGGMIHFSARNISTWSVHLLGLLGFWMLERGLSSRWFHKPKLHRGGYLCPERGDGDMSGRWWVQSKTRFSCLLIQSPPFFVSLEMVVWVLINSQIHFKGL